MKGKDTSSKSPVPVDAFARPLARKKNSEEVEASRPEKAASPQSRRKQSKVAAKRDQVQEARDKLGLKMQLTATNVLRNFPATQISGDSHETREDKDKKQRIVDQIVSLYEKKDKELRKKLDEKYGLSSLKFDTENDINHSVSDNIFAETKYIEESIKEFLSSDASIKEKADFRERLYSILAQAPTSAFAPLAAAPALWKEDRLPKETPPDFVRRVYAEQIEQGMTQADLMRVDAAAYRALHQYAHKHKADGVKASDVLPPKRVAIEDRQGVEPRTFASGRELSPSEMESHRLYHALKRRAARADKRDKNV